MRNKNTYTLWNRRGWRSCTSLSRSYPEYVLGIHSGSGMPTERSIHTWWSTTSERQCCQWNACNIKHYCSACCSN